MAIDSNVLLKAIVPDVIGSAKAGFDLGTTIRNAPLLRQIDEQKKTLNDQLLSKGKIDAGTAAGLAAYQLVGDAPITPENYSATLAQLQNVGVPFEDDDFELTEENVTNLQGLVNYGKQQLSGGDFSADYNSFLNLSSDLSKEEQDNARRIRLGLAPRAIGSSDLTIAETGKSQQVADSKSIIEAGKAEGAIVGKEKGEDIVKLNFLESNLPNIRTTVDKLKQLSKTATYTTGGKIVDTAFRELGFEVPQGANSRAQAISIVNSTILPLLKPTFGSAFTEREGDKLIAVWGDPDASPIEKQMALDGMMMAIELESETVRRKLGKSKKTDSKEAAPTGSTSSSDDLKALESELGL